VSEDEDKKSRERRESFISSSSSAPQSPKEAESKRMMGKDSKMKSLNKEPENKATEEWRRHRNSISSKDSRLDSPQYFDNGEIERPRSSPFTFFCTNLSLSLRHGKGEEQHEAENEEDTLFHFQMALQISR